MHLSIKVESSSSDAADLVLLCLKLLFDIISNIHYPTEYNHQNRFLHINRNH